MAKKIHITEQQFNNYLKFKLDEAKKEDKVEKSLRIKTEKAIELFNEITSGKYEISKEEVSYFKEKLDDAIQFANSDNHSENEAPESRLKKIISEFGYFLKGSKAVQQGMSDKSHVLAPNDENGRMFSKMDKIRQNERNRASSKNYHAFREEVLIPELRKIAEETETNTLANDINWDNVLLLLNSMTGGKNEYKGEKLYNRNGLICNNNGQIFVLSNKDNGKDVTGVKGEGKASDSIFKALSKVRAYINGQDNYMLGYMMTAEPRTFKVNIPAEWQEYAENYGYNGLEWEYKFTQYVSPNNPNIENIIKADKQNNLDRAEAYKKHREQFAPKK